MELIILQFFEKIRCGFLTAISFASSLFGETLFLILLICLIYWLYDKKLGERLVVTSFTSMTINGALKCIVARPRPYVKGGVTRLEIDNPLLSTMDLQPYESFPSGHSQMGAGLFFSGAFFYNKKWGWILFPILTVCVMLSRLYFGVHYPTDVLFGASLGILFAWFWDFIYKKTENKKYYILISFAALSVFFIYLFPGNKTVWEMSACTVATTLCLPLENKYIDFQNATSWKNRGWRALVGFICVGVVYGLFSFLPFAFLEKYVWKFVKYFLVVVTGALLVPYLFKKLKI
ncbi:MAG: phosphatase PAP2 family protein [Clostridia bacterium]|nr:phosphatase PAP2 family protein [Clostridia bacterium]